MTRITKVIEGLDKERDKLRALDPSSHAKDLKVLVSVYFLGFLMPYIIKRVSWFKSSLLLRIQTDYFTNINS